VQIAPASLPQNDNRSEVPCAFREYTPTLQQRLHAAAVGRDGSMDGDNEPATGCAVAAVSTAALGSTGRTVEKRSGGNCCSGCPDS